MLIQLNNVTKNFVVNEIFSNVKLEINDKDRVAIVGRNGAGKSTLLKIISGAISFDSGERTISKNTTVGYLSQEFIVREDLSIYEEMITCFDEIITLEAELEKLSFELTPENIENDPTLLNKFDRLQNEVLTHKDYHYKSKIESVLYGLDFTKEVFDKKISTFSGGEKTRLSMAKLLLSEPDLLVLDEPTNHLDMENVAWLENYLSSYNGAIVIVSHDRYFLDKVVNVVYNLEFGKLKKYVGNYSKFLVQYEEDYEKQLKEYTSQQKDIKKLEEFVQKNIARASTSKMAKSRQKVLDKMDLIDNPKKDDKAAGIEFLIKEQSGRDVLTISDLQVGYNGIKVGQSYNLSVYKGDRIAVVGRNGIGKSTLIKTIAKRQKEISGSVQYGSKVSLGYYDQKQAEFESSKTILNELWDEYPLMKEAEVRTVLGRFLFRGDDVLKIVRDLSGGEKARLQLAKLMLERNNLLILDEPTNHLDITSKQVLEEALKIHDFEVVHLQNSASFLRDGAFEKTTHQRLGIILYGALPYDVKQYPVALPNLVIKNPITVYGEIVNIVDLKEGECIGYSNAYIAEKDKKVGVVNIGYGDGILRDRLRGNTCIINNKEKDIYATMMSHLVVEISEKEKIGDKVFLYDDIQQLHNYVKYFGPNSVQLAALNYNSLNVKKIY